MKFVHPYWLLIGVAVCAALAWRYRRFDKKQTGLLASFISTRLAQSLTRSFSPVRRRIKRSLIIVATACLFIALARPQAGFHWEETHRKGLEIMFAVDTSKSMLAQDVKPNRLTRAKLAVEDLLDKLNGDGVGLVAFAGSAFLQCPVTLDYDAFRQSVEALDTDVIPRGGTDIAAAIQEAETAFKAHEDSDRILVLITDGEDLDAEGIDAAKAAAKDGVKIFTVGVGSKSGELIPVSDGNGGTQFVKDASGNFVKSHLDETTLKAIAAATDGLYEPLGQQGQGLVNIYEQGLKSFTRHDLAARQHKVYLEQYRWPLFAALLLFFVEPMIGTRRRLAPAKADVETRKPFRPMRPARAVGAVAIVLAMLSAGLAQASPGSAEKAYKSGKFKEAVTEYSAIAKKEPANAQVHFNVGAAAYKAGDFSDAESAFQNALKTEDLPVQQSAYYNLGNAQYRVGEKSLRTNPQDTIKTWQTAIQSYDAALQIKPDDKDAKYNRDLVKRKLEQLQKQQKQQQKKDQQKQNDKKQNQQDQSQQKNSDQQKDQQKKQENSGSDKQQQKDSQKPEQSESNANQQQPKQSDQKKQQDQASAAEQSQNKKISKGTPEPNAKPDQADKKEKAPAPERREPGQMTKEEAQRLLDSLKNEDRKVAPLPLSRGQQEENPKSPVKDW